MGKNIFCCLSVALLQALLLVNSAWSATLSGTITNNTGKTGRIYISAAPQQGSDSSYGVSIAGAGAYAITGVQSGATYNLSVFVDTQGTGIRHANDPVFTATKTIDGTPFNATVVTPTLVAPQANQILVYQGNGGNMVIWKGYEVDMGNGLYLPIADKYRVSWSASPSGPATGSKDVLSGKNDMFFHQDGTTGLYYQVTALVGAASAATPWSAVTTRTGGYQVTGTVDLTGVTATGPLLVVLADESSQTGPPVFFTAAVANPSANQDYTINNVPPGTYSFYAILDMNNNGTIDAGDIESQTGESMAPVVTVVASNVPGPAGIALAGRNADAYVTTQHNKSSTWENYNIVLKLYGQLRQPINVKVSGRGLENDTTVGLNTWGEYRLWFNPGTTPVLGDTYTFKVYYLDAPATPETITASVSALLDNFPTPVSPEGFVPFNNGTPTLSWTTPNPVPAGSYSYSLWLSGQNFSWSTNSNLPSSQTTFVYTSDGNASPLVDGSTYNWSVQLMDSFGNSAQYQAQFTPTTSPAINSFSPIGGLAGTTVTISGVNFSTTPALNVVRFNGVAATVSAATSTSLTVTVPASAFTGNIQVTTAGKTANSANSFFVAAPIYISGVIKTSAGVAIVGAKIEKSDDPSVFTTTAADGSFTLNWLFPGQIVVLKITKSGYVPTYTTAFNLGGNLDLTPYPSHLYTQAELTAWGVNDGKGVIVGQVLGTNTLPYSPVGGVTVTAQSSQNYPVYYPVTYYSGGSFGGISTYGNGFFIVLNVNDNDWASVNAVKSPWNFNNTNFSAHANSVTEGGVFGSVQAPNVSTITPLTGKAGTTVTISGFNFSTILAENVVLFSGTAATVTAANSNSLTVTVPAGASTGPINVTTAGGTASYWNNFTPRYTFSETVSGNGQINGTLVCGAGMSNSSDYDWNAPLSLTASASYGSVFTSWSDSIGCPGALCSFNLIVDTSLTASFNKLNNARLLNQAGDFVADFDTLKNAYTDNIALADGYVLKLVRWNIFDFTETLTMDKGLRVKLSGGFDAGFAANSDNYSKVRGPLRVKAGRLVVENVTVTSP